MEGKRVCKLSRRDLVRRALTGILALLAALSALGLLAYTLESRRAEDRFASMAQKVHAASGNAAGRKGSADAAPAEETPEPVSPLEALRLENSDLIGWVTLPDTKIDYPVMHTPEQPQYYLRRNFDKAYSLSGTPFLDGRCTLESDQLILWGHNMQSGTMFAGLLLYQDSAYAAAHALMSFTTAEEERRYEVVAAFRSEVNAEGNYFRWYDYLDLSDQKSFDAFTAGLRAASLIPVPDDLVLGDDFLTLATCSYHDQNGRFVVVGRLVPQEAGEDGGGQGA